ncbi:MAG: T9SS type A sorting domain-containing protein [Ignavibacteriota bacterium]
MKNLFNFSISQQRGLSMKMFAAIVSLCASLTLNPSNLFAQGNALTVSISNVKSVMCDTLSCCLKIHVDVAPGTTMTFFSIYSINSNGASTPPDPGDCWNLDCAVTEGHQYVSNGAITNFPITPIYSTGGMTFNFNPIVSGGTNGAVFEFIICAKDPCAWTNWASITWAAKTTVPARIPTITIEGATVPIGAECDDVPLCPTCDKIDIYRDTCYMIVCLTQHWPSNPKQNSFNLHFSPGLPPYPCSPTGGCSLDHPVIEDSASSWSLLALSDSDWTLSNNYPHDDSLSGCQTICIDIPTCDGIHRTVSVTNDNGPCSSSDTGSFKIAATENGPKWYNSKNNFPNPLSALTQFKTTIPFVTPTEGMARITIFNEIGKIVFKEKQEFSGAGQHFFYFTGERLPAGKYFYTIESPLGKVIVKQSLLIVK